MRQDNSEVNGAMEMLGQALSSLHYDANVLMLEQILQEFSIEHVSLHDFIWGLSCAISNLYGTGAIEVTRHLEEAAAEADKVRSPMRQRRQF